MGKAHRCLEIGSGQLGSQQGGLANRPRIALHGLLQALGLR